MRKTLALLAMTALAACGQGGGGVAHDAPVASNEACDLIEDASAIFGADVQIVAVEGDAPIAAVCQFTSADGARSGEVDFFSPQSLGATTAEAQLTTLKEGWDAATETPLASVENFAADESVIATGLPGYQTQIAFRAGANVIAIQGSSGDAAMNGEQVARALAAAALAKLPPAP